MREILTEQLTVPALELPYLPARSFGERKLQQLADVITNQRRSPLVPSTTPYVLTCGVTRSWPGTRGTYCRRQSFSVACSRFFKGPQSEPPGFRSPLIVARGTSIDGVRMPPSADVMARRLDEDAEAHLPFLPGRHAQCAKLRMPPSTGMTVPVM